jgi:hypothetical protein
MDLARCLEDLVRMLTPLPRLERTDSSVDCSSAPHRPSPSGRRVGSSEKLSRPAQGSPAFRPAHLHLGCAKDFPRGSRGRSLASPAPVATGAYRQFPGRDFHPLVFETQEVSPQSEISSRQTSFRAALPAAWRRAEKEGPPPPPGLSRGGALGEAEAPVQREIGTVTSKREADFQ